MREYFRNIDLPSGEYKVYVDMETIASVFKIFHECGLGKLLLPDQNVEAEDISDEDMIRILIMKGKFLTSVKEITHDASFNCDLPTGTALLQGFFTSIPEGGDFTRKTVSGQKK
jgi:hypothetical protein